MARIGAVAALFALTAVPLLAAAASGEEPSDLKSRMEAIQARLDAATVKVEELREDQDEVLHEIADIEARMAELEDSNEKLQERVIKRANAMYRTGSSGMVEVLFSADDFADLTSRAELMSRVSVDDSGVFVRLYRAQKELTALSSELTEKKARLADTEEEMEAEAQRLQGEFDAVAAEYEKLQAQLAAQAAATLHSLGSELCVIPGGAIHRRLDVPRGGTGFVRRQLGRSPGWSHSCRSGHDGRLRDSGRRDHVRHDHVRRRTTAAAAT